MARIESPGRAPGNKPVRIMLEQGLCPSALLMWGWVIPCWGVPDTGGGGAEQRPWPHPLNVASLLG